MPKYHNHYEGQTQFQKIEPQEVTIELYSGQVRKYRLESVTDPKPRTVQTDLDEYWRETAEAHG